MTGYKSGLALTEGRFRDIFIEGGYERFWPDDPDIWLRIHPEQVEEIFAFALHKVGVGPPQHVVSPLIFVYHRLKHDPAKLKLMTEISARFTDYVRGAVDEAKAGRSKRIDPSPFLEWAVNDHGADGLEIALMITEATLAHQLQSPWSALRRVEWQEVRQLEELFTSEHLESPHGEYFDERFANFLAANFEEIDRINWRQFEGLAAEYFKHTGFDVELGPGRNDNGVDIRLRPNAAPELSPTVILVQCKRQRAKIEKIIVKGLWADIVAEGADSGVVVTTSTFSPGAATIRTARGYEIVEADRDKVREFVNALRTPGAGTFLGE
jgi:restriction system protein